MDVMIETGHQSKKNNRKFKKNNVPNYVALGSIHIMAVRVVEFSNRGIRLERGSCEKKILTD